MKWRKHTESEDNLKSAECPAHDHHYRQKKQTLTLERQIRTQNRTGD